MLQDVRDTNRPFGGITTVFGGDFHQILPVIFKGSRPEIVNACLQRSSVWQYVTVLKLEKNMRVGQDPQEQEFARWQLEVGRGQHTDPHNKITIPGFLRCEQNTVDCLIQTIYPGIGHTPPPDDGFFAERTILSARNTDVDDLNHMILAQFPGQERVFQSADSVEEDADAAAAGELMYPVEYLNSINFSGLPLATLRLKIGVPVMILRTLNPSAGVYPMPFWLYD
jgi:hypothetical protein